MNYVFGYGSLINSESRARTGSTGEAIPVRVTGIERAWNFVMPPSGMAALGVVRREGAAVNGVLVAVADPDLGRFDERESGYARTALPAASIHSLQGDAVPPGSSWVYIPLQPSAPTAQTPIIQSYVDVVMIGCLEFGESFAAEFVRTTTLWDAPWLDDRSRPRYERAMPHVPPATQSQIDRILEENGAPLQRRVPA